MLGGVPNRTPDGEGFDISRFRERRSTLRNEYASYQDHHREIAEYFRPHRGHYLSQRGGELAGSGSVVTGHKRSSKIINSTPLRVSKNAQSGLQAGVTSPSRPWKRLVPMDEDVYEIPGARIAFAELDKRMDFTLSRSNFYQAAHTSYADFVNAGPAALQIDEHRGNVIQCQAHPLGSWVAACNESGMVDVFYRDYNPTGYEISKKFGPSVPPDLQEQIRRNPYKRYDIHNAIEPNPFFREGVPAIGLASFPYLSVWWAKGYEKDFLKVHGYHEFPVFVFRFYKTELTDAYGYGPGFDGLGDAKQLQHQERTKLLGHDMMVRPPLQAPTSLRAKGVSLVPGKVTYHNGPAKVESLVNVNLPLQYILEDIEQIQQRLSQTFFEDLFLMVSNGVTRQTTAREIDERHEEKLIMLGPVLESMNAEFLDPAIERILQIMRRAGQWPEFPDQLDGVEIDVEYTSILAQAQRAVRTIATEQGVNFAATTAQFLPDVLDRIDSDGLIEEYFEDIGFPPRAIKSLRDAQQQRDARAQQQQTAQGLEAAQMAASAAKDGAAATEAIQPNVLQRLIGT